jgi:UDP-N-acetylglucosamine--N-acetylmuramyl-(pentapeptide) pyrophosphoryl-undecaprenol N-acetylglucosamine transferase
MPLLGIIAEIFCETKNFHPPSAQRSGAQSLQTHITKSDFLYIGSKHGIEKSLISHAGIPFKAISTGKLRRYFSFKNFIDFFKIPIGIIQAFFIIKKFKPDLIFSKGGYVAFPVVYAGHLLKKKIILHESDVIPGLANKMAAKYAHKILLTYEESIKYFPNNKKIIVTGNPIRTSILEGSAQEGYKYTGFTDKKPVLLVIGGSQGAEKINKLIYDNLDEFLKYAQIVHICGKGKQRELSERKAVAERSEGLRRPIKIKLFAKQIPYYKQYEYLDKELKNIFKITSLAISRAGANVLSELHQLHIPSILIPLSLKASRGDQIENALVFEKNHGSITLLEDETLNEKLKDTVMGLLQNPETLSEMKKNLEKSAPENPSKKITEIMLKS